MPRSTGHGQILALDVGDRRIGVAISNETRTMAIPHTVVERQNREDDLNRLCDMVRETEAKMLVVGLPLNMDGTEGPKAHQIRRLISRLKGRLEIPVTTWDERLTTVAAEKMLVERGMRRKKRKGVIDTVAAQLILQNFLDHKNLSMDTRPNDPSSR